MDRLTSKQLRDLLDFLRAGYTCHDQEAFVTHLLSGISTLIPSEVTSYTEIDLRTGPVEASTRVMPIDARFPEDREIFAAHMAEHPIVTYWQQTGDGRALKISDFLTQRQFHRLGLYREFYRQEGVEDQMTTMLPARPPRLIGIGLHRGRRNFSERDRLLLNLLRPHLVQVHSNTHAVSAIQQEMRLLRRGLEASRQQIVVLSRQGRVRWMTPRAHQWLSTYFDPTRPERLPETLRAWVSHQEAALDRADDVPPPREPLRVQRDGTCLLVRHLCEADRCLLLLEEQRAASEPAILQRDGLTRREAEVLQWVAQGKTNAEIGIILDMSPGTVKKHLQHLYQKLGIACQGASNFPWSWALKIPYPPVSRCDGLRHGGRYLDPGWARGGASAASDRSI